MAVGGAPAEGTDRPDPIRGPSANVPDDARELALDVRAYRREQAASRRRAVLDRVVRTRRWRRYGLSGPLVTIILVIVAIFGGLLALAVPGGERSSAPQRPLEVRPPAPVGSVGGLLTDRRVSVRGEERRVRELRPAVLALLPAPCACGPLVDELSGQAAEFGVRLVLVVAGPRSDELPDLVAAARHGPVLPAYDASGQLAQDYDARGPTLVLVRDDGRVTAVERDARTGRRWEPALRRLVSGT